jgi:SAM-dependent methyltransferase
MAEIVGAIHDFHDSEYVRDWASRFVPTPPRLQLFELIFEKITEGVLPSVHVVELGIGPGYMARFILERARGERTITYEGIDFSSAMFDIARETLGDFMAQVTLTTADLLDPSWAARLTRMPGAIISTWALHDLGSEQAIGNLYEAVYRTLPKGGVLLNGDFIKPDGTRLAYEPGRITIGRHLALLKAAGFAGARCLTYLEPNLVEPTSANNYACFHAVR